MVAVAMGRRREEVDCWRGGGGEDREREKGGKVRGDKDKKSIEREMEED